MDRILIRVIALIVIGLFVSLISGCSSMSRPYIDFEGIGFSTQFGLKNLKPSIYDALQIVSGLTLPFDFWYHV